MSTAVAVPPASALPSVEHHPSPRAYPPLAPSTTAQMIERPDTSNTDSGNINHTPSNGSPSDGKKSPLSSRGPGNSKVIVKKEPGSPTMQGNARHRPRKLDLNTTTSANANGRPSAMTPLTGREGFAMHDVGLACLSPGFQTHDPAMREQIHRSISVRDQQRSIIEARLLKSAKGDGTDRNQELGRTATTNAKKRPPPGLSIVPPPAQHFANERVIQSAPLNQTFTGRNQSIPGSRPTERPAQPHQPTPQTQQAPAVQTANRLPSISVFLGSENLQPMATRPAFQHSNSTPSHNGPPLPSPGFPPQTAHPGFSQPGRPREYRSAEEAVHELTGGREDLQPKIVRYGGHQPPTPPSPRTDNLTPHKYHPGLLSTAMNARRRSRNEYEGDSSPPLGAGRTGGPQTGPFGEGRDSPATQKAKKEEFLSLCARAWDLFHS